MLQQSTTTKTEAGARRSRSVQFSGFFSIDGSGAVVSPMWRVAGSGWWGLLAPRLPGMVLVMSPWQQVGQPPRPLQA